MNLAQRIIDYIDCEGFGCEYVDACGIIKAVNEYDAKKWAEVERLRAAILEFLRWENEREHNDAEWLEATEKLAEAAEEKA